MKLLIGCSPETKSPPFYLREVEAENAENNLLIIAHVNRGKSLPRLNVFYGCNYMFGGGNKKDAGELDIPKEA